MKESIEAEAHIEIEYSDEKTARTIAKAVSPDNIETELIKVDSYAHENKLIIKIVCKKNVGSLLATIDDILFSIQTAEKALKEI
ncbi:MAG: KEOPS complex subunit Pcc1 [Candidatus Asgardarchaeia archaeon]